MRLLLDSHVLVWAIEGNERLGRSARSALLDPANQVWVSSATVWELSIKASLGRLHLAEPIAVCLPRGLRDINAQELGIQHRHALGVLWLPPIHSDPFDRMLVAQARSEAMTLLTVDRDILQYDVPLMDASR